MADIPEERICYYLVKACTRANLPGPGAGSLTSLAASDAVNRLWAKDETLRPSAGGERRLAGENLGWLDVAERETLGDSCKS